MNQRKTAKSAWNRSDSLHIRVFCHLKKTGLSLSQRDPLGTIPKSREWLSRRGWPCHRDDHAEFILTRADVLAITASYCAIERLVLIPNGSEESEGRCSACLFALVFPTKVALFSYLTKSSWSEIIIRRSPSTLIKIKGLFHMYIPLS